MTGSLLRATAVTAVQAGANFNGVRCTRLPWPKPCNPLQGTKSVKGTKLLTAAAGRGSKTEYRSGNDHLWLQMTRLSVVAVGQTDTKTVSRNSKATFGKDWKFTRDRQTVSNSGSDQ